MVAIASAPSTHGVQLSHKLWELRSVFTKISDPHGFLGRTQAALTALNFPPKEICQGLEIFLVVMTKEPLTFVVEVRVNPKHKQCTGQSPTIKNHPTAYENGVGAENPGCIPNLRDGSWGSYTNQISFPFAPYCVLLPV